MKGKEKKRATMRLWQVIVWKHMLLAPFSRTIDITGNEFVDVSRSEL
jgi:hypothetical protein